MQTPTIILAIVALIGLIAQRKKFSEVLSGTVKTALGYLVLSAGSSLLVTEILPFVGLFQEVFNLSGFATGSEIIVGAMQDAVPVIASTSAIIMGAGFLVNILLARITPLKYIFLTGHMMWINSVAVAFCLYSAGMSSGAIIGIGIVLQGIILTLIPAIAQPVVRKITGSDDFAIGHLTTLSTVSSAYVGKLVGKGSKSAEDMKLPEGLKFFKDTSMSIAIVMFVFYMLAVILAGPESVGAYSGGTNYLIYGLLKALGFTAGVMVLLQGVRMLQAALLGDVAAKTSHLLVLDRADGGDKLPGRRIRLPDCGSADAEAIFGLYCIQLVCYRHALGRGVDPDSPEGLEPWIKL